MVVVNKTIKGSAYGVCRSSWIEAKSDGMVIMNEKKTA